MNDYYTPDFVFTGYLGFPEPVVYREPRRLPGDGRVAPLQLRAADPGA